MQVPYLLISASHSSLLNNANLSRHFFTMFVVSSLPYYALMCGYSATNIENHKHAKFCEKLPIGQRNTFQQIAEYNINHNPQLVEVMLNLKLWVWLQGTFHFNVDEFMFDEERRKPPQKFRQRRFFGQQDKFGESQFFKTFACVCVLVLFFPRREIFLF